MKVKISMSTFALFHGHPNNGSNSWQLSTPGNNAENNGLGDSGAVDKVLQNNGQSIQIFAFSNAGLGMYSPGMVPPGVLLRPGLSWTQPCK